jgi:hypothetical protein
VKKEIQERINEFIRKDRPILIDCEEEVLEAAYLIKQLLFALSDKSYNIRVLERSLDYIVDNNYWRPVDTAPEDEMVLVVFENEFMGKPYSEIFCGRYNSEECEWFFTSPHLNNVRIGISNVTHWMPLPKLPEK